MQLDTRNAYNNVKDLNRSYKLVPCTIHFPKMV